MPPRKMTTTKLVPDKLRRQYLHVLEGTLDRQLRRGMPIKSAYKLSKEVAARTVNKYRKKRAGGRVVCKPDRRMKRGKRAVRCRVDVGPQLIGRGGRRFGWYPGKPGREVYVCLKHRKKFRGKAQLMNHYRSHAY